MRSATLSRAEARRLLVSHLALARTVGRGARGVRAVLKRLRCIQIDPLDVIGTNADLVVMARVDDASRGDVWKHLFPHHAFEHFAKERCILPAEAFPWYRQQGHAAQTPWWRHNEREQRVPETLVSAVLDEIRANGPVTARDLTDHGAVEPIDWSGWKGTAKATSMALEILWTRCDIVVAGRTEKGAKVYDVPGYRDSGLGIRDSAASNRIPNPESQIPFPRWALRERATAAGLLSRAGGSMWSMLSGVRTSTLPDEMIADGELIEIAIEDSPRKYLAVPEFLNAKSRFDNRVRVLGPLDPLLWDRNLVRHVFDFDYVWEVYKPKHLRKWGWYVCPLLYRDRLVGRVDATSGKLWIEDDDVNPALIRTALERFLPGKVRRLKKR